VPSQIYYQPPRPETQAWEGTTSKAGHKGQAQANQDPKPIALRDQARKGTGQKDGAEAPKPKTGKANKRKYQ